ncbi:unnamed protein product, partial [Closterium sp. Naga37s-1]
MVKEQVKLQLEAQRASFLVSQPGEKADEAHLLQRMPKSLDGFVYEFDTYHLNKEGVLEPDNGRGHRVARGDHDMSGNGGSPVTDSPPVGCETAVAEFAPVDDEGHVEEGRELGEGDGPVDDGQEEGEGAGRASVPDRPSDGATASTPAIRPQPDGLSAGRAGAPLRRALARSWPLSANAAATSLKGAASRPTHRKHEVNVRDEWAQCKRQRKIPSR